ncbi:MAG: bifunctional folylpolyglutamate synthase/dihydrofolate synthase [Defluviitaleaceae bacterium]|nr:bifunctional folylpolyglutamate synthase/dihydrofolate synthase [Defluviitaleaceae bacterium]
MNHEAAMEYLVNSFGQGRKKGMDAVLAALAALDNPQEKIKIIHVAGTNGKGSFCAMMGNILEEAGYRVGSFTSPHMEKFNERFTINGEMISDEDFARHLSKIAEISGQMYEDGDGFSYFELLTMLAFCYFYEQAVDFLLLEVGIGGRNDCTNVIKNPILSAIMAIGFDHMDILGDNLSDIAREKGGIIKKKCPVVLYDDVPLVYNIFKEIAADNNAKVYSSSNISLNGYKIGLIGEHQRKNAQTVVAAINVLRDLGFSVDDAHIYNGLEKTRHMGRMEIMGENPTIILEGAHNLQGAEAAAYNMQNLFVDKEITVIMGMMADKEFDKIVNVLAGSAKCVVFTKPFYDHRAADPKDLAACLTKDDRDVYIENDCTKAYETAKKITSADGVILVTGSLYLVGDIRTYIKRDCGLSQQ